MTDHTHHRKIRSFVTRAGRLSKGQQKAIESLGPQYLINYQDKILDLDQVFQRSAKRIIEIGFGMGASTAEIALKHPEIDYLGIEVHEPGVGALLKLIGEYQLNNIRIIQHDAVEVLNQMIDRQSIDGIHIFFPDPWHKARHHKRRLIQPEFIHLLSEKLSPNGYIHCATDWQNYAEHILSVLQNEPRLSNTVEEYAPRPSYRSLTKFEQRGLRLGHGIWDIIFKKI